MCTTLIKTLVQNAFIMFFPPQILPKLVTLCVTTVEDEVLSYELIHDLLSKGT